MMFDRNRVIYFNSRPSARGDFDTRVGIPTCNTISIHAPPRGATQPKRNGMMSKQFQFTPLREGRRVWSKVSQYTWNFNSRPSARGDIRRGSRSASWDISIHAPPRGATLTAEYNPIENYISIHAPPRGATKLRGATFWHTKFQFTPLREGRQEQQCKQRIR